MTLSRHARVAPLFLLAAVVLLSALKAPLSGGPRAGIAEGGEDNPGAGGREKTSGALEALNFWTESRAWPEPDIPKAGYVDAHRYARAVLEGSGASPAPSSHTSLRWRPIGPTNIGGRTLAVAFNPQNPATVYAGSASGGLWRSWSGGVGTRAWQYVRTGYPAKAISSIAIAPNDSNTIYLGTGEVYNYQNASGGVVIRTTRGSYGLGILKSTDGGATWSLSLDWSLNQDRGVWGVRIDPSNTSRLWAATTEGIYRSDNAGASWSLVLNVVMATDVEISPADGNIVLAACGNFGSPGYGVYRTTNAGATWTRVSGIPGYGGMARVAFAPSAPQIAYASVGNGSADGAGTWLCRSDDGGATWTVVSVTDYATYQGWYSHDVAVDPANPQVVFAAGIDIWKSTTGGTNLVKLTYWENMFFGVVPEGGPEGPTNYSHADHHAIAWSPAGGNTVYFGTDGGVFRTVDGGATFEGRNGGYQTTQFYNGFSSLPGDTLPAMGGMQDNSTGIYQGTGAWKRVIGGDGCWTAIDPGNASILYGSWQYLNMLKSTDGGVNFTTITPPNSGTTAFSAPYILLWNAPQVIYAGRSVVWRSTDRGASWTMGPALNGNPIICLAAAGNTTQNLVYAGTAPNGSGRFLYKSINAGGAFTDVTGTLPNRYPMDIAIDLSNTSRIYVVLAGFGTSHVFKSDNGASSWQDIGSALPDVPTSAVLVDPLHTDHIYVGNDLGVFVTFDRGLTWGALNSGLPDAAIVTDLSLASGPRRLRAATHGNGVYEIPIPDVTTGVPEEPFTPMTRLTSSPNPFRSVTRIEFSLAREETVDLAVFDVRGRKVRSLIDGERLQAGAQSIEWDGRDDSGRSLASGRYFARLKSTAAVRSFGLLLVR